MKAKQFKEEILAQLANIDDDADLQFILDCDRDGYRLMIQNYEDGEDIYEIDEITTYE